MGPTTRRPHRKSRHGCQLCKKNRTKCDEQKPSCSRCTRIGAKCSLLDPTSAIVIIHRPPVQEPPSNRELEPEPNPLPSPSATSVDSTSTDGGNHNTSEFVKNSPSLHVTSTEVGRLMLMNHYNQSVAKSICDFTTSTEQGRYIWRVNVPNLAFQNDYLLHGLLSVTALHMALCDLSQQREMGVLAVQHHSRALTLFAPHIINVTADNVDTLFAFTCITALYSFGIHLKDGGQLSPLAKIHEAFAMLQGTKLVVCHGLHWLKGGIWASWFPDLEEKNTDILPDEIEETLVRLQSRIATTITTSSQSEMYSTVIDALKRNFIQAKLRPLTCMSLVTLPVLSPPEFRQMICIAEPLALAILANWAVILHWLRRHIWVQHWGAVTIKAVQEVLPPSWHDCIIFPLRQIEMGSAADTLPGPSITDFTPLSPSR